MFKYLTQSPGIKNDEKRERNYLKINVVQKRTASK